MSNVGPGRGAMVGRARERLVGASILAADFTRIGEECEAVLEAGADLLHLDVMDGHFVPNLTMGPDMVSCIRKRLPDAWLDVHLMITDPQTYAPRFAEAGADHVTFHIEAAAGDDAVELSSKIRSLGASSGIAISPGTDLALLVPVLGEVDLVLVMSIQPGFSGQSFRPETLERAAWVRERGPETLCIQMDGGLGADEAALARGAGVDCIAAASSIFKAGASTAGRGAAERYRAAVLGLRAGG